MAVDVGSFTSGFGDFFSVLGTIFSIIFAIGLIGLVGFLLFREMQFKIPVTIHKVLANGSVIEYSDKARKIKKNGQNELKLRKFKDFITNPPGDFYLRTGKGEKLYLRWDGGHVFVPQKVGYNSPLEFTPATYNILNQMTMRIKQAAERHKNKTFWDLYGQIVVWLVVIILSAVVMIVMFSELESVGNALNAVAASVSELAKSTSGTQVVS